MRDARYQVTPENDSNARISRNNNDLVFRLSGKGETGCSPVQGEIPRRSSGLQMEGKRYSACRSNIILVLEHRRPRMNPFPRAFPGMTFKRHSFDPRRFTFYLSFRGKAHNNRMSVTQQFVLLKNREIIMNLSQ